MPPIAAGEVATVSIDDGPTLSRAGPRILLAVRGDDLLELDPASSDQKWPSMDQTNKFGSLDASGGQRIGDGRSSQGTGRAGRSSRRGRTAGQDVPPVRSR